MDTTIKTQIPVFELCQFWSRVTLGHPVEHASKETCKQLKLNAWAVYQVSGTPVPAPPATPAPHATPAPSVAQAPPAAPAPPAASAPSAAPAQPTAPAPPTAPALPSLVSPTLAQRPHTASPAAPPAAPPGTEARLHLAATTSTQKLVRASLTFAGLVHCKIQHNLSGVFGHSYGNFIISLSQNSLLFQSLLTRLNLADACEATNLMLFQLQSLVSTTHSHLCL
ncbi:hypothetical protein FHG87_002138 [Trinorchestia longiramus]|nr:hypothetical protein FHG87_002138 [Trinorchestia longiramus]